MAMDNDQLGTLVRRYNETAKKVDSLRNSISESSKGLKYFSDALHGEVNAAPGNITVGDDQLTFTPSGRYETAEPYVIPISLLNDVHAWLAELKTTLEEKTEIENNLTQAGLGRLIR